MHPTEPPFQRIQFYLTAHYDCSYLPERRARLYGLLPTPTDPAWFVSEIVAGQYVRNHADLFYSMADALRCGWEGLVLKDPAAPYLCGERTWSWLKCKDLGSWS